MNAFQPLLLPNGTQIPNRIAKAAMEENLAALDPGPSAELLRRYRDQVKAGLHYHDLRAVAYDRDMRGGQVLERV